MSAGALLYLLLLVHRRAGKVHAEAAEEGLVDIREDDGGVNFVAAEAGKLLHGELRMRIGCGADGERNEKLIGADCGLRGRRSSAAGSEQWIPRRRASPRAECRRMPSGHS